MSHDDHGKKFVAIKGSAESTAREFQRDIADTDYESKRNFCLFSDSLSRQLDGFMVMDQPRALVSILFRSY